MITEEGRHIYHRNNNGLEDSEDYASFYGSQFANYYNRVAGDTPLVMIGSELGYNAGQLGNDWEDETSIFYHRPYKGITDFGHISIEVDGIVYNFGRYGRVWGIGGSKGEAVYLKVGREKYLRNYNQLQELTEYKLNLTEKEEENIKKFFEQLPRTRKTVEVKNTKTGIVLGTGIVLKGEYTLLGRNCTIMTIVSINNSAKKVNIPVIVSPNGLKSYLDARQKAEKNGGLMLESHYNREPVSLERIIIKEIVVHKKK